MEFCGKYKFLSNFYPCQIEDRGIKYPSVEHAYQAVKTIDLEKRKEIAHVPTAMQAKRLGRHIELRAGWEKQKYDVMKYFVAKKFRSTTDFTNQLLATGNIEIVEDNYWNDTYWGVCKGVGENNLGKILMKVREELLNEEIKKQK